MKKGSKHTDETKKKIFEARKNQIPPNLGKKFSDEIKANMSKGMLGNTNTLGYKHTDEDKIKMSKARKLYLGTIDIDYNSEDYKLWSRKVTFYTGLSYKTYLIDPLKPLGRAGTEGAYQLDHMYPISLGFIHNIEPEVIGHPSNLKLIPWRDNLSKKNKLLEGLTIEVVYKRLESFEKVYGKVDFNKLYYGELI